MTAHNPDSTSPAVGDALDATEVTLTLPPVTRNSLGDLVVEIDGTEAVVGHHDGHGTPVIETSTNTWTGEHAKQIALGALAVLRGLHNTRAAWFALAADVVLFAHDNRGLLNVLLIERGNDPDDPFAGCWALPGGCVEHDRGETFDEAARRELAEETGLTAPDRMVQVGVYDAPDRDPRGRVISVAYAGFASRLSAPTAGDDAAAARWVPVDELDPATLAFDHADILRAARALFPAASGGQR